MSTSDSEPIRAPVVIYAASSADGYLAPPDGSVTESRTYHGSGPGGVVLLRWRVERGASPA